MVTFHGDARFQQHLQNQEKMTEICLEISLSNLISVKNGVQAGLRCGKDSCGSCNLRTTSQLT